MAHPSAAPRTRTLLAAGVAMLLLAPGAAAQSPPNHVAQVRDLVRQFAAGWVVWVIDAAVALMACPGAAEPAGCAYNAVVSRIPVLPGPP